MKVRFCVNNPRSLAERDELIARGYDCKGCLGNCDRCFETRFLEIGGRFVEGEDYAQIRRAEGADDGASEDRKGGDPKTKDAPGGGASSCGSDAD